MQIVVFSDSHGAWQNMIRVACDSSPDLIVHLGDHAEDALHLSKETSVPILSVAGNSLADGFSGVPTHRTVSFCGHRLYLCHGHLHRVKSSLLALSYAAAEENANVALFGHTHTPCDEVYGDVRLINPGSARSSYALLNLTEDAITCEFHPIG